MKKALVLGGGGTRGSYQNGAIHALRRLGKDDWDIVTGTSIGALNGVLCVQKDYKLMDEIWANLTQDQIVNGSFKIDMDLSDMIAERNSILPFFRDFLQDRGVDIAPMKEYIARIYNPEKFFASDTEFGLVVCRHVSREPVYVTKAMMKDHGLDWLIATASAYPAFPVHRFEDGEFIDGGYYDNLPIDEALQMGAEEIIAIDLAGNPNHPNFFNRTGITYIFPQVTTGSFLSFDRKIINRLETLGYYDTMKAFGMFDGVRYTFGKNLLPAWFPHFMHEILILETKIQNSVELAARLRSSQVITDRIASMQHQKVVDDKRMFYGFMDYLMSMCGCDLERVWNYREARNRILAEFAPCMEENYEYSPSSMTAEKILAYTSGLDSKGVISKLLHALFYPSHNFLKENVWLTVYPFEKAAAMFIAEMMRELNGEG